jgi:hypothetical protein
MVSAAPERSVPNKSLSVLGAMSNTTPVMASSVEATAISTLFDMSPGIHMVPGWLSFCATTIWKPGALCVVGSTGLSVKMMVVPGVITSLALVRKSVGSPLFCAAKKRLSLELSFALAVTCTQRRWPSASVPWRALKTRSFKGETTCGFRIPARPISTPLR